MSYHNFEHLLPQVQKPGRYTGGEPGSVMKNLQNIALRFAFCFPDAYEIGMSHLGLKILYGLLNVRDDCWCERVFTPWIDMQDLMRHENIPLWALESGDPIHDFDVIGFTLQYEMSYSNVLHMLDLAGLPLHSSQRESLAPLVIAGGPCACNPEPLAPFIDVFVLGEGEEVTNELLDLLAQCKREDCTKEAFLCRAAQISGIYVPAFYDIKYAENGTIAAILPQNDAPEKIKKRNILDLNGAYFPENFVVPLLEIVHDRTVAELFRGCIRGCRFCQAGYITRPVREKSPELVSAQCRAIAENTGYEELSLCSLSTSDYEQLPQLLDELLRWTTEQKVNVAAPSLRVDQFPEHLMERLKLLRRSGLTFAPEAGTQRLRDVINKNITQEQVLDTVQRAFSGGWSSVKLYFMLGLPTETEKDIVGIAELAQAVVEAYYQSPDKPKGRGVQVTLSAASFVPKPFTPFQWEAMARGEAIGEKQALLRQSIRSKKISLKTHKCDISLLESVFARGDRRLADVLEAALQAGLCFDGWDERFDPQAWRDCFMKCGLDPDWYLRAREQDEILPWDHLDYGVTKAFLWCERERAYAGQTTPHCREKCADCGIEKCALKK